MPNPFFSLCHSDPENMFIIRGGEESVVREAIKHKLI